MRQEPQTLANQYRVSQVRTENNKFLQSSFSENVALLIYVGSSYLLHFWLCFFGCILRYLLRKPGSTGLNWNVRCASYTHRVFLFQIFAVHCVRPASRLDLSARSTTGRLHDCWKGLSLVDAVSINKSSIACSSAVWYWTVEHPLRTCIVTSAVAWNKTVFKPPSCRRFYALSEMLLTRFSKP